MNAPGRLHFMPRQFPEFRAHKLWPAIAAIALGIMLARWTWILLAPASMAALPPADTTTSAEAEKVFGEATSGAAGAGAEILPGAQLVGVFAPAGNAADGAGFAVVQLDEKHQAGVALGAEVAPGVILREIHADHVVLERDGITQQLNLEGTKLKENPSSDFVAHPPSPARPAISPNGLPQVTNQVESRMQEMRSRQWQNQAR